MSDAVITSRQNVRVRDLRAALRGRAANGFAAVEGWILLEEALRPTKTGLVVQTVFVREDVTPPGGHSNSPFETVVLSRGAFESAAGTENSQGVAAIVRKPERRYAPSAGDLVVVAADLQDPGNLGTLIRSAEALGAAAVACAGQTADPWNGKALRASAGSVFRMPLPTWSGELHARLRTCGIRLFAAVPRGGGAVVAAETDLRGGCAFMIGNEGKGLSPEMLALADARISLLMPGPTESLNAAVAGSLLLYEAARQRRQGR